MNFYFNSIFDFNMPRILFIIFTLKSGYMPLSIAKITFLSPKIAGILGFLVVTTYFSKNAGSTVICALFTMPLKKVFRSTFCEISNICPFSSIFSIWNPLLFRSANHIFRLQPILSLYHPLRIRSANHIFGLPS